MFLNNGLALFHQAWSIVWRRLQTQGLTSTLLWLYGRILPWITGVPLLGFSRITPNIYVGPQYRTRGKVKLEAHGIDAGVNLRLEYDDAASGLALTHYCYLPTVDDTPISLSDLEQGVAFITEQVQAGRKVYIHCAGGIGRAPTMAAAYFISQGMHPDEALALIRRRRPFIKPVPSQLEQLHRFAVHIQTDRQI